MALKSERGMVEWIVENWKMLGMVCTGMTTFILGWKNMRQSAQTKYWDSMSAELASEKSRCTQITKELNDAILARSQAEARAIVLEGELKESKKDLSEERELHLKTRDKSEARRVSRDHYRSIAINANHTVHQYGLAGVSTPIEEHIALADEALSYPGLCVDSSTSEVIDD